MTTRAVAPIDPFCDTCDGAYVDELVTVRAVRGRRPRLAPQATRTEHFDVVADGDRLVVAHTVPADAIDDDLAGLLATELFAPGLVRGAELFERIFTGVVRSSAAAALDAWERFYRGTLRRLDHPDQARPGGSIAGYAPVHDRATRLLAPDPVLELGCCFGFWSLRVAATGRRVTASDVSPGTIRLLAAVAPRLGIPLSTRVADAAHVPAADGAFDTVVALHLLEHLEPDHGGRAIAEAVRLARRRVIVAVPLEHEANTTFGHVRTVALDDLRRWGQHTRLPFEVHEHHGGWLVIDHPTTPNSAHHPELRSPPTTHNFGVGRTLRPEAEI